jgi:hypothetical protein
MSEPAKDETDLVQCMAKAMHDSVYKGQTKWEDTRKFERYYREAEADAALAAIRAAGWAVVPQTKLDCLRADNALLLASFMEKAAEELEKVYDMYCSNHHQYERDMELPRAIRAMLAAAPGVEP